LVAISQRGIRGEAERGADTCRAAGATQVTRIRPNWKAQHPIDDAKEQEDTLTTIVRKLDERSIFFTVGELLFAFLLACQSEIPIHFALHCLRYPAAEDWCRYVGFGCWLWPNAEFAVHPLAAAIIRVNLICPHGWISKR